MTFSISFEVFPPKTDDGLAQLADTVSSLGRVDPAFVSVTYGAGGSGRARTFDAIRATSSAGARVAGHLTCVAQPTHEVDSVIDEYSALGVERIVALRGDPPAGVDAGYEAHPDGYQRTADLVAAAKRRGRFEVIVSAYPERHPQSPTDDHDLDVLAEKVAAGADRALTQMFFDNAQFFAYVDRVRARGLTVPVSPGIFPIHSFPAVARFAGRCGAGIPDRVAARFEGLDDDVDATHEIAAELAAEQITELVDGGVDHVHLYTLNRAELALAVCAELGLVSRASVAA
jgi:methylenetetrahydrofolate reductase (NADPH)